MAEKRVHVALILASLDPVLEPHKTEIFAGEELLIVKNTFGCLNHSFLGQSFVVSSNNSSALVSSASGHGSDRSGGRLYSTNTPILKPFVSDTCVRHTCRVIFKILSCIYVSNPFQCCRVRAT